MAEEAVTSAAEESGAVSTEEENTASTEEAEASVTTEDGTEEGEQVTEEEPKKDAQARIQELANAKRELTEKLTAQERQIADLAAKFEAQQKTAQAPGAIDEQALASYLEETEIKIETLKAEGKTLDAALLQRRVSKLLDDVEAHRQKESEWKKTTSTQEQQTRQMQESIKELESAADFFRESKKIPADVWDAGATQWAEARQADPVLDRQYAEVWMRQGPVAAINFAYEHMQKAQTAAAEKLKAEKAKKDAGKVNFTGTGEGGKPIASWEQLMGLGSKQVEAYKKSNPKHYQKLLDTHLK